MADGYAIEHTKACTEPELTEEEIQRGEQLDAYICRASDMEDDRAREGMFHRWAAELIANMEERSTLNDLAYSVGCRVHLTYDGEGSPDVSHTVGRGGDWSRCTITVHRSGPVWPDYRSLILRGIALHLIRKRTKPAVRWRLSYEHHNDLAQVLDTQLTRAGVCKQSDDESGEWEQDMIIKEMTLGVHNWKRGTFGLYHGDKPFNSVES